MNCRLCDAERDEGDGGAEVHYVVADVHNDGKRLRELQQAISFCEADQMFILGDLFDRCEYDPDPVGVYFTILKLGERCKVLRGNHDEWLAKYILNYYGTPEQKRKKLAPYRYNSFDLLRQRLTPVDMQELARWILAMPSQLTISVAGTEYILTHDMSLLFPDAKQEEILATGVEGCISVFGHVSTPGHRIWKNDRGNVFCIDCGCGYRGGRLGCLCLETGQEVYV